MDGAASAEGVSPTLQYDQLQGDTYVPISGAPVHAGSYEVTATFAPQVTGYTPVSDTTTFTITPFAFTCTIANDQQTYGTPANLANDLAATIATGFNGENLDIAYASVGDTGTAHVAGSPYPITGTLSNGIGLTSDYIVTLNDGGLTVSPYAFTYMIANDQQTYGTPANLANDLAATIATGVNGENLDIAYASVGDTGTAHVAGSPYPITGTLSNGTGLTSDYSVTLNDGGLTVSPYAFTYTIANDQQTYGTPANLANDLAATIATGVNRENLDIAYASMGDTGTAHVAGSPYPITGTLSNGTGLTSDYSVTLNDGGLTVSPYAFTYTIANDQQTYGTPANLANDLAAKIATGVNGQNLDIAYASVGDTGTAHVAGSPYPITGTLSNGTGLTSDYSVTLNDGGLTVSPYAFTYTIANDQQTYGTPANLANDLATTIATGVNRENLDIAYASMGDTGTAHVAGSPYPITGTLSNGTGLTSDYSVTLNDGGLTVSPYAFTYTIANDQQTYGTPANLANDLAATIATGVNRENLDIAYASMGDTGTAHVAGSPYPITGTLSNGTGLTSDYSVTLNDGGLTVSPYAFTYTIANDQQTYGTPANLANDLAATIATGFNRENLDIAYASVGDTGTAHVAGSPYPITGTLSNGTGRTSDYSVTLNDGGLTVSPYAFTYMIANDQQTYGTPANLANDLAAKIATGVNGQNLDIAYASVGDTGTAQVAGSPYPITGTLSNGIGLTSDYSVTLNDGGLTVSPYAFTYMIANDQQTYGTPANLANDLAATIATGFNGQNLDIAYASVGDTGTAHVAGSPYPITGTLSNGTGLTSDYSVTLNDGGLTVSPYAFTYMIANDQQTYGTPANLANDLAAKIATGVNGQNLDIAYASVGDTGTAHVAGSPYPITGTLSNGTGLTSDYSVTLKNGALTVDPAPLTITASNASMVAGQPISAFIVEYSPFVLGEGPGVLSGALTITTAANAAIPAGTYPIIPGGLSSPNYAITYVDGTLAVAAPLVTVTNVEWVTVRRPNGKRSTRVLDVIFSGALNPTSAENVAAFVLDSAVKSKKLGKRFIKPVPFKMASYSSGTDILTLTPRHKFPKRRIELTIRGTLIQDAEGRQLDGHGDGQAGSNYVAILNHRGPMIAAGPPNSLAGSGATTPHSGPVADARPGRRVMAARFAGKRSWNWSGLLGRFDQ